MSIYVYHLTASDLKRRGWTESLIKEFCPSPDDTTLNPWYKSAAPIRLYLKERIANIEASSDFQERVKQIARRKQSAAKAVNTKIDRLHRHIEAWTPTVPRLEMNELIERACDSYNSHKLDLLIERGYEYTPATPESDESFLHRITVNYLRHHFTSYERKLAGQYGKVGVRESYILISRKIFAAISDVYPGLADECQRQLRAREYNEGNK